MFDFHCLRYKSSCSSWSGFLYSSDQHGRVSGGWSCWLSAAASACAALLPSRRSIGCSQRLPSCFFRRIFGTCWKRGRITSTGCCPRTNRTLHSTSTSTPTSIYPPFVTFPVRVHSLNALDESRIQPQWIVDPKRVGGAAHSPQSLRMT